jgi:DNA topoisomerase-1
LPQPTSDAAYRRLIVGAIDSVAGKLGNTRAVCRGSYIHPGVFEGYRKGVTIAAARPAPRSARLSVEEAALLKMLRNAPRHSRRERKAA